MTIQYELDFTIDYLTDLLLDLRYMAHTFSTASSSVRIANDPAYLELLRQIRDMKSYAFISDIIGVDYYLSLTDSIHFSTELYWSR